MRPYEVMVIFDIGTEPTSIQAGIERIVETVQSTGGNPGAIDRWGRRPFAYEVNHKREGYYVLIEFSGEVQTVNDLDRFLSLADEVVRHKIIRIPEKMVGRPRTAPPGRSPAAGGRRPPRTGGPRSREGSDQPVSERVATGGPDGQ
jgi:small subunit ribosomal protein S6